MSEHLRRIASNVADNYSILQRVPVEGTGSQTPTPRDRAGKPLDVSGGGMMRIPGYEWHDKSEAFHRMASRKRD